MPDPIVDSQSQGEFTLPPAAVSILPPYQKRAPLKYLLAVLLAFCIYIPFFFFTQPVRVGDGSEYYAMGVAWAETHRPYMTETGWDHYALLYQSNAIPGINSSQQLREFSPRLTTTQGQDFNHFWFYSLSAALIAELGDYSGIDIPLHTAFLILHCLLLTALLVAAFHFYGWQGLFAALILTLLSPVFWYLDKVHTEFFTFILTSLAVLFFLKHRFFASALWLALAATQNISFILISLYVLAWGIHQHGRGKYTLADILLIGANLMVNAMHPLYYLLRYGVPSPQFLSGSAQAGLHLSRFWIWLLDPDVGLLPNWWFSVVILLLALIIAIKRQWRFAALPGWLAFTLVFLVVNLVAQSSTINLNSGASAGPSRYALWYLCLFLPALLLIVRASRNHFWITLGLSSLGLVCVWYSVVYFLPVNGGTAHCQPSALSWWLQKNLPGLYNPPAEIFTERYGGLCEGIAARETFAVIGPDCHKIYLSGMNGSDEILVTGAASCALDLDRMEQAIYQKVNSGEWSGGDGFYRFQTDENTDWKFVPLMEKDYLFAAGNSLTQSIGSRYRQWGLLEEWGFWSVGKRSTLEIPCPAYAAASDLPSYLELGLEPFVQEDHPAVLASIELDGQTSWSGKLTAPQVIRLSLPQGACAQRDELTMRIFVTDPISRAALGISGDMRRLGVGLQRLRYLDQ